MKRKIKLTNAEKAIEAAVERGEYAPVSRAEFNKLARVLESRKKDTVLHVRINSGDLKLLKKKASKLGVRYQTFITELLHRIAHS